VKMDLDVLCRQWLLLTIIVDLGVVESS